MRAMLRPSCLPRQVLCGALLLAAWQGLVPAHAHGQASPTPDAATLSTPGAATLSAPGPGIPFTPGQLTNLLPATVYFQGRTAPLQLRNAGGITLTGNQIVWVSLVDSSGYASSVQEKYQFYLVTEGPLRAGGVVLPAGAYGGGFLRDHFLLMDLGGHTVAEGPVQTEAALPRPRPLQVVGDGPSALKLFLGRRWIVLRSNTIVGTP